jgi:hypothetical protein
LFSTIKDKIDITTLYQELTNKEQNDIKPEMFTQLLMNLNIENALKDNFNKKTTYGYEDLLILDHDREHFIKIPIGIKFNKYINYLYPASPFDLITSSPSIFDNSLLGFDNSLLLNYGNLLDNELYLCMANDIFDYSGVLADECRVKWLNSESGKKSVKNGYTKVNPYPKSGCLTALGHKKWNENYLYRDGVYRYLSQTEIEKLQTLPVGYTKILSYDEAYDCIGDGWTVDVISHIFNSIPYYNI